ncbi:MAG: LrgB family protein [Cloacibacillus evryensis]
MGAEPLRDPAAESITTAIGMGVSAEAGGIVTITVVSIITTGILKHRSRPVMRSFA